MFNSEIDSNDTLAVYASENRLKVYSEFNPYFVKDIQIAISNLEQVPFYYKKLGKTRYIGEFAKDETIKRRKRKKTLKTLMKYWGKDFKETIEKNKDAMLEKNNKLHPKRIRKIRYWFVILFTFILITAIFISKRVSYLKHTPLIKNYVSNFYDLIEKPLYYNLLIVLIYLTMFTIGYIIVLRTYFETLRKVSKNAENFIESEFDKILESYKPQYKKMKRHLYRSTKERYKKQFEVNKIYDPNVVIQKLDAYSLHVEEKVLKFRQKYYWLLLVHFLLKVCVLGVAGYLGYMYYITY